MLAVVENNHQAIERWREDTQSTMIAFASSNGVRVQARVLRSLGNDATKATETRRILTNLLTPALLQSGNLGYLLIDPRNVVIAASDAQYLGLPSALGPQPEIVEELFAGRSIVTLPLRYQTPARQQAVIVVAGAPVTIQGRAIAALLFYLDPSLGYGGLLQLRNDGSSETYAFNSGGYMLSPIQEDLAAYGLLPANTGSTLSLRIADPGRELGADAQELQASSEWPLTEMAAAATRGQNGSNVIGYRDYLGRRVLGAWTWDPDGYGIATEVEHSLAFPSLRSTYLTLFVLAGLSSAALLAVVFTSAAGERRENRIRKRYEMTIEGGLDAVITFDGRNEVSSWNPQAENIFGYAKEEVIGKQIVDQLFPTETLPVFRQQLDELENSHDLSTRRRGELAMLRRDGSHVPVDVFLVPLKISGENGYSAVIRDMTAIQEARVKLRMAHDELTRSYDETLRGWSAALDLRDNETEGHTLRVTEGTMRLAAQLGMGDEESLNLYRGALLHDIGKIGIPDNILRKPGPLNDSEWVVMKQHTVYAHNMLKDIPYLIPALDVPLYHHEKWDGSGYPRGLKNEGIPFTARLFSVVDVWDALSSDRPYRKAWSEERVLAHIVEQSGTHFDPEVVKLFLQLDLSDLRPDAKSI